jgi:two-component system response regulator FixJ
MNAAGFVVHVVDDDPGVRRSLEALLRATGFATSLYDSPFCLLNSLPDLDNGCLLLDLQMKGMTGLELVYHLRASGVGLPVVVMTGLGEVNVGIGAVKLGVTDVLEKPFSEVSLLSALGAARAPRYTPLETTIAPAILRARSAVAALSNREREVLIRLADGKPQKVIAHELGISVRTVEVHRARMLHRLGTPHLAQAIRLAALAELSYSAPSSRS